MRRSTVIAATPQRPDGWPRADEPSVSQHDPSLWQLHHGDALAPVWLSLRRVRSSWRLLTTVGIGMLVTVTLICTVPLYSTLIATIQVRHTLTATPAVQRNIATLVSTYALTPDSLPFLTQQVETIRQRELGAFAPNDTVSLQSMQPLHFVALNGQDIVEARPDLEVNYAQPSAYDYDQALPHMQLLSGRLPHDVPAGQPLEVLVTPKLGAHVGDRITLSGSVTLAQYREVDLHLIVRVVGIWFPKQNGADPFWNGVNFDTIDRSITDPPPPKNYPMLFTATGLLGAAGPQPYPGVTVTWPSVTEAVTSRHLEKHARLHHIS